MQVQLVQITATKDTDGNWTEAEDNRFGIWAEVSNTSGGRDYQNGQTILSSNKTFLVRFRFDKYPGADWKVSYQGREWTVTSIQQRNEKRFYWQIRAEARVTPNTAT